MLIPVYIIYDWTVSFSQKRVQLNHSPAGLCTLQIQISWSGSALFAIKCVTLYQQSESSNLKIRSGRVILIYSAWQGLSEHCCPGSS